MLSCKEATQLVSEGLDRELPLMRRIGLRLHAFMCRGCSRYKRQVTVLDRLICKHYSDGPLAEDSEHVSQDAVQHIKSALRQRTSDTDHNNQE